MAEVGTLDWVQQTHGKLTRTEKFAITLQGLKAKAGKWLRRNAREEHRHLEPANILPPDSAAAREAIAMCEEASEPFLFHHCLRSYFWARLLDDGTQPFDDEATFVAFLLHDMGLTESYRLQGQDEQCFTIVGARMAEELAGRHDWPGRRGRLVAEAITLHLNVTIANRHGREAQLVRMGSGADVAGLQLETVARKDIQAVCQKYPRIGMKREIVSALRIETQERPCCRIAFLNRSLGFSRLIRSTTVFSE